MAEGRKVEAQLGVRETFPRGFGFGPLEGLDQELEAGLQVLFLALGLVEEQPGVSVHARLPQLLEQGALVAVAPELDELEEDVPLALRKPLDLAPGHPPEAEDLAEEPLQPFETGVDPVDGLVSPDFPGQVRRQRGVWVIYFEGLSLGLGVIGVRLLRVGGLRPPQSASIFEGSRPCLGRV